MRKMDAELRKPDIEWDMPLLKKLWENDDFYKYRREKIASFAAGKVQDLVEVFPLLHHVSFVSMPLKLQPWYLKNETKGHEAVIM